MDEPVDMAAGDADIGQHGVIGAAQAARGAPAVDRPRYATQSGKRLDDHDKAPPKILMPSDTWAVDLSNK
jgi:hypothetical protein